MAFHDLEVARSGRDNGRAVEREIDLDRVVWDPDYRRSVVDRLNRRDGIKKNPTRRESADAATMRMTA